MDPACPGPRDPTEPTSGGLISRVEPDSIAEQCGLLPGDLLLALDGQPLRDVIDYRFLSAEPRVELLFRRGRAEQRILVEKDPDEDLGIEFESSLFDGVMTCRSNCVFCFVKNLPRGLRPTLYIKDDDYRLSFLFGNFVTLGNLGAGDLDRIERQRLSPLYVSVHATERGLRNHLMGVDAPDILDQIDRLGGRRIEIHAQVVLCPGLNDGVHLEQTIDDLAQRRGVVASVGVVPVGLTRFYGGPELRRYRAEEGRQVVRLVENRQREFRKRFGSSFVHLSDEFYTMSGVPVPAARRYDGFPQLENGIGLVRRLLSHWACCRRGLPSGLSRARQVGWVSGTSAYATLRHLAEEMNRVEGLHAEVHPVVNRFFGDTVTVSGLLTGADVVDALKKRRVDGWILPGAMFDDSGQRTLDGMTLEQMRAEVPDPIDVASSCRGLTKLSLYGSAPCAG